MSDIVIAKMIAVDGHLYQVVSIDVKASLSGRQVTIQAFDAETANRIQQKAIEHDAIVDSQASMLRAVTKAVENVFDGPNRGNGENGLFPTLGGF